MLVLDNVSEALQASCEAHWNITPANCDAHWHSTKATQEAHTTEFLLEDCLLLWALVKLKLQRQTIYFKSLQYWLWQSFLARPRGWLFLFYNHDHH